MLVVATLLAEGIISGGSHAAPSVPYCYAESDGMYHPCHRPPTAQDWVDWGRDT